MASKQRGGRGGPKAPAPAPVAAPVDPATLPRRVAIQIEFYFSDRNLVTDRFFQGELAKSPEGWLETAVLLNCNRVKALTDNLDVVKAALRTANDVFEVTEDAGKFRRKVPFVAPTEAVPAKANEDRAVIVVQNIAKGTRWNIIKAAFEGAANVVFVKMSEVGKGPKAGPADKKRGGEGEEETKAGGDAAPAAAEGSSAEAEGEDGSRKRVKTEDGSAAAAAAPTAADAADAAPAATEAAAPAGAGSASPVSDVVIAPGTITAHVVVNRLGKSHATVLAGLLAAGITIGGQKAHLSVLEGEPEAAFWTASASELEAKRGKAGEGKPADSKGGKGGKDGKGGKGGKPAPREAPAGGNAGKPITLAGTTFANHSAAVAHFKTLLKSQENGKALGAKDGEHLTALLAHHADPAKAKDVDHFTVGPHPTFASKCFIIVRKDGTKEDFSVRKCLDNIAGIVTANEAPVAGGGEAAAADVKAEAPAAAAAAPATTDAKAE